MPPPLATSRSSWSSILPAAIVLVGLVVYMELRLTPAVNRMRETEESMIETLGKVERSMNLIRIEQSSEGQGIDALLEKLAEFAPHMQRETALTLEYEPRMEEVLGAVEALGPDSYGKILAAYRDSEPGEQDELRRWLMPALVRADPKRAEEFLASVARGVDPNDRSLAITARNRQNAAMELVELNKRRAAEILASIFSYESARGVNPARVPAQLRDRVPPAGSGIGVGFDTLLNWYLATEDPEIETTLIRILKSNEHKLLSKQTSVKWLGEHRVREAAGAIERLYLNDPEGRTNPLFLNHCLDALGSILRGEACDFFREQVLEVQSELVLTKLESLIVEHCGSAPRKPGK